MKPNVLLIMVDQMRADCLSIMKHPAVDTPNLDQLARKGVVFRNAYSATPSCVPARESLLTGMSQTSTGVVGYEDKIPWNHETTIAGEFNRGGYHTQAIGKMHVYPTRNLAGFHNVVLHDGYMHYSRFKHEVKTVESQDYTDDYLNWLRDKTGTQTDLIDTGLDCNASTVTRPWHLDEALHPTNWVTTQSIDFLRRRDPSKPFFLKMSFVRPHPPFDPPQAFYDMYRDTELPDPPVGDWVKEEAGDPGLSPVTDRGIVPKRRFKRAQAAYYALITHIDHQIGRFLNAMQEYGVYENTVILFASDHGEMLGDHNRYRKSMPYEGSAKIPFILSDPGNNLNLERGTTADDVVEIRDIMPTLLEAADLDVPDSVDGENVIPLCQGSGGEWRDYIHGEHVYGKKSFHYVTDGSEKYIWFSQTGEEQFFDLKNDPHEKHNLIENNHYKERIQKQRMRLVNELKGREEEYVDGDKLITGRKVKATLNHVPKI